MLKIQIMIIQAPRFQYLMNGIDFLEFGLRNYGGLFSKSVHL